MSDRTVLVAPERLRGWTERFAARHGEVDTSRRGASVVLRAADGAVATWDETPAPPRFGIVLARRGGYAVGLVDGAELTRSKCGTRYVQGRTKAGGWSQQRYARRRANQADGLIDACAAAVERVLGPAGAVPVFGGGDRPMVPAVLARAAAVTTLQGRWLDVPEPRHAVLVQAVEQARAVTIGLNSLA